MSAHVPAFAMRRSLPGDRGAQEPQRHGFPELRRIPDGPAPPNWPEDDQVTPRLDWRDKLALGADVALIGIVATVFALPLLTAPAALAAASTAIRHRYRDGSLPKVRPLLAQFRHGLLRGIPAILLAIVLFLDLTALARGWVPGGAPLLLMTAAVTAWLAGLAGVSLAALARNPSRPWREAAAWAWSQPRATAAVSATSVLAVFLALTVPATIPLLIGVHLFATNILTDRLNL
jgi:hypothetical protein